MDVGAHMATLHPLDHLLIATGFIRQAVRILAATATFIRILEFNPVQEKATPSLTRNLRVGALLDTTRASKTPVSGQKLPGSHL